jgi:hypothetical protein
LESNQTPLIIRRINGSLRLQFPGHPLKKKLTGSPSGGVMVLMERIINQCTVGTNRLSAQGRNRNKNQKISTLQSRKLPTQIIILMVAML